MSYSLGVDTYVVGIGNEGNNNLFPRVHTTFNTESG